MDAVRSFGRFSFFRIHFQMIGDMNAPDNQHIIFFLNFSPPLRIQIAVSGWDSTRLQRAAKGPGQSTGGSGNHIIQGGGMGFVNGRINLIMLSNL
jgi:hypothetical protein